MDKIVYIYKITNKINGKVYIGKSQYPKVRWTRHIRNAKNKINRYLYDAMNHYGYENFYMEIIETSDNAACNERERYWIKFYKSEDRNYGYNMTPGGDGGNTWEKNQHKEATSKKLSKSNTGKKRDKEFCERMREFQLSRPPMPIETKEKISRGLKETYAKGEIDYSNNHMRGIKPEDHPMFGKTHTDEAKEKISMARTGKSYEEIFGEEEAKIQRQKRRDAWTGEKNINYKKIDNNILLEFLKMGYNNFTIAEYFNVARATIIERTKTLTGMTANQFRKLNNIKMIKENVHVKRNGKD